MPVVWTQNVSTRFEGVIACDDPVFGYFVGFVEL